MAIISMKQLLEAGVHFVTKPDGGIQKWLLISSPNGTIYIIDSEDRTHGGGVYSFIRDIAAEGGSVLCGHQETSSRRH